MIYFHQFIIFCALNNSVDGVAFFNFTMSFQFLTIKANLLFTVVKFLLMNKLALRTPMAFLLMDLSFFLFRSAFQRCFLLITRTITFFFFFPRRWQASISFEVILTSIAFNMSTTFSSS